MSLIPEAGPSRPPPPCILCAAPSKYSCPRCTRPTCSAPCSKSHKIKFSCDGTRDPAQFVDLASYTQGTWARDYTYLEEGRRKVMDWGSGFTREAIEAAGNFRGRGGLRGGGGRGAGRGGRGGGARKGGGRSRTDALRRELEKRGCWVVFMPEGMSKRKMNQSSWNPRTQNIFLTIHLHLILPSTLLSPTPSIPNQSSQSKPTTQTTQTIPHPRVLFSSSKTPAPSLQSLLPPTIPNALLPTLTFLLPFHPSPSRPTPEINTHQIPRPKLYYPPLNGSGKLDEVFPGTSWIEFPVIEVVPTMEWEAKVMKGEVMIVPLALVVPRLVEPVLVQAGLGKRKLMEVVHSTKITPRGTVDPRAALGGLGDYGSDEEEEEKAGEAEGVRLDEKEDGRPGDALEDEDDLIDGVDGAEDIELDGLDEEEAEHYVEEEEEAWEGEELSSQVEEDQVAGVLGAIELPGGADMLQKVGEALLADFGEVVEEEPLSRPVQP